jgi:hypothetical protein
MPFNQMTELHEGLDSGSTTVAKRALTVERHRIRTRHAEDNNR